jgi:hypothetical protein
MIDRLQATEVLTDVVNANHRLNGLVAEIAKTRDWLIVSWRYGSEFGT